MLEVTDICKKYGKSTILKGVTFSAKPGECVGIIGGNGCGKTTFLSLLAGVSRPDSGSIRFNGDEAVGKRSMFEKNAAYVPQENPLIPELSAKDNYYLWFRGDRIRMGEELRTGAGMRLGLKEFFSVPAGKLSGGQKKRLSIAAALSNQAAVLIMDEPGAALDLAAKQEILNYIKEYTAQGGIVVLTSHEMAEISVCTKLYILKNGALVPVSAGMSARELIGRF